MRKARLLQHTDPLWITDEIIADRAGRRRPGRWECITTGIDVVSVQTNEYREQAGGIKSSVAVLVTIISEFVGTRRNAETVGHEDRRARVIKEIGQVSFQIVTRRARLDGRAVRIPIAYVSKPRRATEEASGADIISRDQQVEIVRVGKSEHRRQQVQLHLFQGSIGGKSSGGLVSLNAHGAFLAPRDHQQGDSQEG